MTKLKATEFNIILKSKHQSFSFKTEILATPTESVGIFIPFGITDELNVPYPLCLYVFNYDYLKNNGIQHLEYHYNALNVQYMKQQIHIPFILKACFFSFFFTNSCKINHINARIGRNNDKKLQEIIWNTVKLWSTVNWLL